MAGSGTNNSGNRSTGGSRRANQPKGGHNQSGNKQSGSYSAEQRKALQKIRPVIPKDKASDEELMTMLVECNYDSDRVVRQYFEAGQEHNEWSVSTNRRDQRKEKKEGKRENVNDNKPRNPQTPQPNSQPRGQPREQRHNNGQNGAQQQNSQRPPAPMPAQEMPAAGNTWASRLRGPQAPHPVPEPHPAPRPTSQHKAPANLLNQPITQDINQALNQSLNEDSQLQFGGYSTQELPQQNMFMSDPSGMLPAPHGLSGMPTQPFSTAGGSLAADTPISNLPESEVNSATVVKGDVLRSHTQQSNLWSRLVGLWDNRELVDLKLKPEPGDKRISVHAVVLAAASSTVSTALKDNKGDSLMNPPELLVHCECSALEECVRFCYMGELRVSDEGLENLWYAASVLELREVLDLCVEWAQKHIHTGNAHTISKLAEKYHIPDLKAAVDRYVLTNMQTLVQEEDFLRQPLERITDLLSSDDAKFDCELDVFWAVSRWIMHDLPNRGRELSHLMKQAVRLPQLDFDELEKVELHELVTNDPAAKALMHDVYRYLAAPTQRRLGMDIAGSRPRNNMLQH